MNKDLFDETPGYTDFLDTEMVMHREAHFGGSFAVMIDYYDKRGKGVQEHFSQCRMADLCASEKELGVNLAPMLLKGAEAERVAGAKKAYIKLRSCYEDPKTPHLVRLIADLILSEEDWPEKEMNALAEEGTKAVDALLHLIRSAEYYDPLFPGYGKAPWLAAEVLGRIGDKKALFSLFELLGSDDFANDDIVLSALKRMGEPAKQMALKVLKGRPWNFDNERAAVLLLSFSDDPEVRQAALELLEDKEVQKMEILADYLVLICENIREEGEKKRFLQLIEGGNFSKSVKRDMQTIASHF